MGLGLGMGVAGRRRDGVGRTPPGAQGEHPQADAPVVDRASHPQEQRRPADETAQDEGRAHVDRLRVWAFGRNPARRAGVGHGWGVGGVAAQGDEAREPAGEAEGGILLRGRAVEENGVPVQHRRALELAERGRALTAVHQDPHRPHQRLRRVSAQPLQLDPHRLLRVPRARRQQRGVHQPAPQLRLRRVHARRVDQV